MARKWNDGYIAVDSDKIINHVVECIRIQRERITLLESELEARNILQEQSSVAIFEDVKKYILRLCPAGIKNWVARFLLVLLRGLCRARTKGRRTDYYR